MYLVAHANLLTFPEFSIYIKYYQIKQFTLDI